MKKKNAIIILVAVLIVAVTATVIVLKSINGGSGSSSSSSITNEIVSDKLNSTLEYDKDDENDSYDIDAYITVENGSIKVSGDKDVDVSGNTVTIKEAGNYSISGTIEAGNIVVDTDKESVVKLLLDNASITSEDTAAIYVKKAEKCIVTAKSGTTNTLTDASDYSLEADEDEPRATLYSKSDIVINGTGNLIVNANYNDCISTSDALRVFNVSLTLKSVDDGIRGKDYVFVKNATLDITVEDDGIKSTNSESDDVGFIIFEDSDVKINAGGDGIDAETSLYIDGGNFDITTGGGSDNSSKTHSEQFGFGMRQGSDSDDSQDTTSQKGIKAGTNIEITSGTFTLDTADDSIHSNNIITINAGDYNIKSGDDGIHADTTLNIKDGNIKISKSYEGLESLAITIDGGNIDVTASDDGINVAGGNDGSSVNGREGQNNFNLNGGSESSAVLTINGGTILVNADGDGLDSNGNIYINGGDITVYGPTDDGNGALDYDGECIIKGGSLTAIGSSGMMQAPSSSSSQYSLAYVLGSYYDANSKIVIKDSSGNEIASVTAAKKFSSIVYSSPDLKQGETYTIEIDGSDIGTITLSDITTSNSSGSMGMNGGLGGMNGGGMQRRGR